MNILIKLICIAIATTIWSCDQTDYPAPENYPSIVNALSDVEKQTLLNQIAQTPLASCVYIDTFGIPFMFVQDTLCIDYKNWRNTDDRQEIEDRFRNALYDFGFIVRIQNPENLSIAGIYTPEGRTFESLKTEFPDSAPPAWLVKSKAQKVNDYTIRGSEVSVLLSPDNAIGLYGSNYENILVPENVNVDEDAARELLLNTTLGTGRNEFVIRENTVWHQSEIIIVPIKKSDVIELRLCWALHPGSWEVVVDTQTGEKLTSVNIAQIR